MIANRRMTMNIVATYGRNLHAQVVGVLCVWQMFDRVGGLTAEKMVKYTPSDDGKNGQF